MKHRRSDSGRVPVMAVILIAFCAGCTEIQEVPTWVTDDAIYLICHETEPSCGTGYGLEGIDGIVTAAHVVPDSTAVRVYDIWGDEHIGRVTKMEYDGCGVDYAIISVDTEVTKLLPCTRRAHYTERVCAMGALHHEDDRIIPRPGLDIYCGEISGVYKSFTRAQFPVEPGVSGGPVLATSGCVYGHVSRSDEEVTIYVPSTGEWLAGTRRLLK